MRPGNSSVNSASLNAWRTVRICDWHHHGAIEVRARRRSRSSSSRSQRPRASLFAAAIHVEAFLDLAALLGDLRSDPIDFVADVDAIGDGALVVVFRDEVLVEEADGLLDGRGGEADEKRVEVFEDLPPEIVDGAMAFVGDDEVEGFDGNGGIVGDVLRAAVGGGDFEARDFSSRSSVEFLAAQHRVEPLDGADGDAADIDRACSR